MQPLIIQTQNNINPFNIDFTNYANKNIQYMDEDFTNSILDSRKWKLDFDSKSAYSIALNKLNIIHNSTIFEKDFSLISNNALVGNFSIELQYDSISNFAFINNKPVEIFIFDPNDINTKISFSKFYDSSLKNKIELFNSTQILNNTYTDNSISGKLKISRVDNKFYFYAYISLKWELLQEIENSMPSILNWEINSKALGTSTGSIQISNIFVNKKTLNLSESFFDANNLNLNLFNISKSSNANYNMILGTLETVYTGSNEEHFELISNTGVDCADFTAEVLFTNISGLSNGNILAEFANYNYYNGLKNGYSIRYKSLTVDSILEFIRYDDDIETIVASVNITGIQSNLFLKYYRISNVFYAEYKHNLADSYIAIGNSNTVKNNFRNFIYGNKKLAANANITCRIDNILVNSNNFLYEINNFYFNKYQNIPIDIFNLENNDAGFNFSDKGMGLSISNGIVSNISLKSKYIIQGNYSFIAKIDNSKISNNGEIHFYLKSVLENKYAKIKLKKINSIFSIENETKNVSTIINSSLLERKNTYIKIERIDFSTVKYSISNDKTNWTILNTENYSDKEDCYFYIELLNNSNANNATSCILNNIEIIADNITPDFNPKSEFNYLFNKKDAFILHNFNNIDDGFLNNFTLNNFLNNGIISTQEFAKEELLFFDANTIANNWTTTSNFITINYTGDSSTIKALYSNSSSYLQLKSKFMLENGEFSIKFSPNNVFTNKNLGTTFFRLLFVLENGEAYDLKLNSIATVNKQQIRSDKYANFNFNSSLSNEILDANYNTTSSSLTEFKVIYGETLKLQYKNASTNNSYIDVKEYILEDNTLKGYLILEVNNTTNLNAGNTNIIQYASNINHKVNNACLTFVPTQVNNIELQKSLFKDKSEYTLHFIFSTFKDVNNGRIIYSEGTVAEDYAKIEKTSTDTFKFSILNHLNNYVSIESATKDFSESKDWLLTFVFSKNNGIKMYCNGEYEQILNDGTFQIFDRYSTRWQIGRNYSISNYFFGKMHQIVQLEYEQSASDIKNIFLSDKTMLSKKKIKGGNYII